MSAQCTLTVKVVNIKKATGKIELGMYDGPKYWLEDHGQFRDVIFECTDAPEQTYVFKDIPYGEYGLSLYHDVNGNGKMDFRTWIPKEPYGFSNDPRAKWSKPSYKSCTVDVNQPEQTVVLTLQTW